MLESVHTLGHFPTQMNNREDATKEELQEHTLYTQIKTNEKNMLLSSRDFLQSMRVKRVDRNAQRRAELENVKETIRVIQSSELKCTCHDFYNWRDLWRVDARLARRLRDTGHHLPDCPLARVMSTLARQMGREPQTFTPTTALESDKFKVLARDLDQSGYMLVTSCLDHVESWAFDPVNRIMIGILLENGSTSPYDDGCAEPYRCPVEEDNSPGLECGASEPNVDANEVEFTNSSQIKSCFVGHGIFQNVKDVNQRLKLA